MRRIALLAFILAFPAVCARAGVVIAPMSYYGTVGQTSVYRTDVSLAGGLASISGVFVTDDLSLSGSTGVFSGFDLDMVFFDADGDLATDDDRIFVRLDPAETLVNQGIVANAVNTKYKPTPLHPGPLFGLNPDGTIDHATATLDTLDASFTAGVNSLSVDGSNGWVTLGDGGQIRAGFPIFTLSQLDSMYLFIGDAGPAEEALGAVVAIDFFDQFELFFLDQEGSRIYVDPGTNVNLDGSLLSSECQDPKYYWDLDGDGIYDDAVGQSPILPDWFIQDRLQLTPGSNPISVMVVCTEGAGYDETFDLDLFLTPEPGSMALLAVGTLALLRRRRR